jgi:hypothetical protein
MSFDTAGATPDNGHPRPSARVWVAAAAEIAVAAGVATLILQMGASTTAGGHHHMGMAEAHSYPSQIHWPPAVFILASLTAAMLALWIVTRARIPAALAAAGLVGLGMSEPVRTMAVYSHLVAMAALEVLMVGVPLLLIGALRRGPTTHSGHAPAWTAAVVMAVGLNSGLLIALCMPKESRGSARPR